MEPLFTLICGFFIGLAVGYYLLGWSGEPDDE